DGRYAGRKTPAVGGEQHGDPELGADDPTQPPGLARVRRDQIRAQPFQVGADLPQRGGVAPRQDGTNQVSQRIVGDPFRRQLLAEWSPLTREHDGLVSRRSQRDRKVVHVTCAPPIESERLTTYTILLAGRRTTRSRVAA